MQKKDTVDDVRVDKRRKIGAGRMTGPSSTIRTRQALSLVNNMPDSAANSDASSDCSTMEFTKEEVEGLLNEKLKGKKFDMKVRSICNLPFQFAGKWPRDQNLNFSCRCSAYLLV